MTIAEIEHNDRKVIIGHTSNCLVPDCSGWIVDSFTGKYWIRCEDPKHRHLKSHVDVVDVDAASDAHTKNDDNDELVSKKRHDQISQRHRLGVANLDVQR
jgi:hypothetical protein